MPMLNTVSIVYKSRSLDYDRCTQYIEVTDGVITDQWLKSNGNHNYTGDGNPELIGKHVSVVRGFGFRKLSKNAQNAMLEDRASM